MSGEKVKVGRLLYHAIRKVAGPLPSDRKIAAEIGISPSTLSRIRRRDGVALGDRRIAMQQVELETFRAIYKWAEKKGYKLVHFYGGT